MDPAKEQRRQSELMWRALSGPIVAEDYQIVGFDFVRQVVRFGGIDLAAMAAAMPPIEQPIVKFIDGSTHQY